MNFCFAISNGYLVVLVIKQHYLALLKQSISCICIVVATLRIFTQSNDLFCVLALDYTASIRHIQKNSCPMPNKSHSMPNQSHSMPNQNHSTPIQNHSGTPQPTKHPPRPQIKPRFPRYPTQDRQRERVPVNSLENRAYN